MSHKLKPPAGPRSSSKSCEVFYVALADKLAALEQAVQPRWLTLEWVSLAVDFMRSTFADMMVLFEHDVRLMKDEAWVEEYMVESMKLLDVCNVLRPAVARFEHFTMCVQLVLQALHRSGSSGGSPEFEALMAALHSCEEEFNHLVHLPLAAEKASAEVQPAESGPVRHASIALGEKFSPESSRNGLSRSRGGSTVALTLVMRATRETTDFVASVLIWALKRDPASHPAATAWQTNLEVFRGDESMWSPAFRRLQERLRKELFEILRDERSPARRPFRLFTFEELKLVEECTADIRAEVHELSHKTSPSPHFLNNLAHDLTNLLHKFQTRLEKVSAQVNQLFDELVRARKKLLDATQRPGTIQRTQTF